MHSPSVLLCSQCHTATTLEGLSSSNYHPDIVSEMRTSHHSCKQEHFISTLISLDVIEGERMKESTHLSLLCLLLLLFLFSLRGGRAREGENELSHLQKTAGHTTAETGAETRSFIMAMNITSSMCLLIGAITAHSNHAL